MTRNEIINSLKIIDDEIDWSDPYIAPVVAKKELDKLIEILESDEKLIDSCPLSTPSPQRLPSAS